MAKAAYNIVSLRPGLGEQGSEFGRVGRRDSRHSFLQRLQRLSLFSFLLQHTLSCPAFLPSAPPPSLPSGPFPSSGTGRSWEEVCGRASEWDPSIAASLTALGAPARATRFRSVHSFSCGLMFSGLVTVRECVCS